MLSTAFVMHIHHFNKETAHEEITSSKFIWSNAPAALPHKAPNHHKLTAAKCQTRMAIKLMTGFLLAARSLYW